MSYLRLIKDLGNGMADRDLGRFVKPFSFTAFVAGAGLLGSTIWSYEAFRRKNGYFALQELKLQEKDSELVPGNGVFWAICGANTLVWLAWKVPIIRPIMLNYFVLTPRGTVSSMLLAAFSHFRTDHIAANMITLYLYLPARINRNMRRATRKASRFMGNAQFVEFYLTACVVTSLGTNLTQLLVGSNDRCVGASGAVTAVFGYVCTRIHNHHIVLTTVPESQFPICPPGSIESKLTTFSAALKFSIAFEMAGLLVSWLVGWKCLGHVCHMFGYLFGIAFCHLESSLDSVREKILMAYHRLRGSGIEKENDTE